MYKKILVATDGSSLSSKAISTAIELAAIAGAELLAMTVVPQHKEHVIEDSPPLRLTRTRDDKFDAEQLAVGEQRVNAVKAQAEAKGVRCSVMTVKSALIAEALIEAARDQHCELIVMASHGYRGIKRVLLGSETQHVL
ncbi:MAG: universal stress protein, partial [Burkholderiales bacterium]